MKRHSSRTTGVSGFQAQRQSTPTPLSSQVARQRSPWQVHADASAPVQRLSTLTQLRTATAIVQRESSYTDVMPEHDTWRDSYQSQGAEQTAFTYHHIIPENLLKTARKYLDTMRDALEDDTSDRAGEFRAAVTTLIDGAASGQWLDTQVQNTEYRLNTKLSEYAVPVTKSEIRPLIAAKSTDLDGLYTEFRKLYLAKAKTKLAGHKFDLRDAMTGLMKGAAFYTALQNRQTDTWWPDLTARVPNFPYFMAARKQDFVQAINEVAALKKGLGSKKKEYRDAINDACKLDTFFASEFDKMDSSDIKPGYLKQILQQFALQVSKGDHFEKAIQWNPGNIHRGPSSSKRLDPKSVGLFDRLVDDGGDGFEVAAANIIPAKHYRLLVSIKDQIDLLLANGAFGKLDLPGQSVKIQQAAALLGDMSRLQAFGLKNMNPDEWEDHPGAAGKLRLKKKDAKLRAVGLIP